MLAWGNAYLFYLSIVGLSAGKQLYELRFLSAFQVEIGIDILIVFLLERHCIRDHEELKAATAEMFKVVNMKRRYFEHLIN